MSQKAVIKRLTDQLLGKMILDGLDQAQAEAIIREALIKVAGEYGSDESSPVKPNALMVVPMLKRCIERASSLSNSAALVNDLKTIVTLLERGEQS